MVHLGIGFVAVALTLVALCVVSVAVPGAPVVDRPFAVGSFLSLGTSSAFLAYVVRHLM